MMEAERTFFCGLGGQKCGTSWLADYLHAHPEVMPNPIKELHVFQARPGTERRHWTTSTRLDQWKADLADPKRTKRERATLRMRIEALEEVTAIGAAPTIEEQERRYRAYFERRIEPHHRAFGEITPAYARLSRPTLARVREIFPNPRFIFLMRDPVDRFWSATRMSAAKHGDNPQEVYTKLLGRRAAQEKTRYQTTLRRLRLTIPDHQWIGIFYEEMLNPATADQTIRRITDFLNISYVPPNVERVVGGSLDASNSKLDPTVEQLLIEEFADTYHIVKDRFGGVPERWEARLRRLPPKEAPSTSARVSSRLRRSLTRS